MTLSVSSENITCRYETSIHAVGENGKVSEEKISRRIWRYDERRKHLLSSYLEIRREKKRSSLVVFGGTYSCRHLLQSVLYMQISGIVIPYILNLRKNDFDPPLPFISHAAGCIPENGLFTFLMIPSSFLGFLLCFVVHPDVYSCDILKQVNKASFWCGLIYFFSWILICSFPLAYTDVPNKYEWVLYVLSEHMVGALLMLSACVLFPILQTVLRWNSRSLKTPRFTIMITVIPVAVVGLFSLFTLAVEELSAKEDLTMQHVSYELPLKLSFYYIVTSSCEWILIISMWFTLGLFYDELSSRTFTICLQKK